MDKTRPTFFYHKTLPILYTKLFRLFRLPSRIIALPAVKLLQALEATLFAASHDETKLVLAGVNFKFSRTSWEAAATDGHRLAVASGTIESNENAQDGTELDTLEITIPYQILTELQKILSSVGENYECTISINNGIAVFDLPCIQITSRLLEGQYPQYSSLIPQQFQHQFTTDRKVFDNALKRVGIVADQKEKIVAVKFDYTNQQATLSTESQDVGGAVESILIKSEIDHPENLQIAFNIKYVADALKFIPTDEVIIKANQPTQPVIITPVGGILNQLILVMPVQLISINKEPSTKENVSATAEEIQATEDVSLINDEAPSTIEIAAEVIEETTLIATNLSVPESTEETTTEEAITSTNPPATKPRGRKKKTQAA
ncbi:DNA polymerase III subunit beta [Fortiea contorta]|uniref:DNA polymerase III subunit beta n=1 Tax=Fortiea contorta TaxID=1892405 RepID=UPI0009D9480B